VTTGDRPFYVFVFAPDQRSAQGVLDRISPQVLSSAEIIRFSEGDAASCEAEAKIEAYASGSRWMMMTGPDAPSTDDDKALAHLSCAVDDSYPTTVRPRIQQIDFYSWNRGFVRNELPRQAAFFADTHSNGTSILSGSVPVPGAYHIRLTLLPGELREGLAAISTEDDGDRANLDRTYRIAWLLEHLARRQLARSQESILVVSHP